MSQVDLNDLEPDAPDDKKKSSGSSKRRSSSARSENDLRNRLNGCFERIANALDERGDEEMAEIIRDDAGIMAQGLVSLTRPFVVLRTPLLAMIAVVEPVLAFGRVARIALIRMAERRQERAAAAQWAAENPPVDSDAVEIP